MGTLGGFPTPPALWLRRAKPAFANAIMGTLGGFPNPPAMVRRRQSRRAPHATSSSHKSRSFDTTSRRRQQRGVKQPERRRRRVGRCTRNARPRASPCRPEQTSRPWCRSRNHLCTGPEPQARHKAGRRHQRRGCPGPDPNPPCPPELLLHSTCRQSHSSRHQSHTKAS